MLGLRWIGMPVAALLLAGFAGSVVHAQGDYPNKPVRLIVGFTPGSSADITARCSAIA